MSDENAVQYQDDRARIQLLEEELVVGKRLVDTEQLTVRTVVDETPVLVEEEVQRTDVAVERVAVDRPVTEAPPPRQDGDTLVISIVEERLVVEKRLFVIEEVRVRSSTTTRSVEIPTSVRSMRAVIERSGDQITTGRE